MFRVKAAIVRRYGSPDVLELTDIPAPIAADDEVLVRIHSSSVCFGDWLIRSGATMARLLNGFTKPRVRVLGTDLAGTVESVGRRVTRFAPGDHVFGSRGDKFGAHAEFACVSETGFLAHKPVNMTFEEAGSVFVGGACALYFLRKAGITPGERVLIHGASGSLGVFAVQLAKHYGAHVTGVCGPSNVDLVKSLGADEVIDYAARDFADGDARYDVICDILGARLPKPTATRRAATRSATSRSSSRARERAGLCGQAFVIFVAASQALVEHRGQRLPIHGPRRQLRQPLLRQRPFDQRRDVGRRVPHGAKPVGHAQTINEPRDAVCERASRVFPAAARHVGAQCGRRFEMPLGIG
jgi:D-arabinose 1-dehydrogenase-like Zn-dependent alcohol dehydrogenase